MILLKSIDGRYFELDAKEADRFRVTRQRAQELMDERREEPVKMYGWNWPNWSGRRYWNNQWYNW